MSLLLTHTRTYINHVYVYIYVCEFVYTANCTVKYENVKRVRWTYGHNNDETCRDVGMKKVIAQATFEYKYDLQTCEVPYFIGTKQREASNESKLDFKIDSFFIQSYQNRNVILNLTW